MQNLFISSKKRFKFNCKAGDRFGRLTFTGVTFTKNIYGQFRRYIEAVCDCGVVGNYLFGVVACGDTQSCGCYRKEATRKRVTTHNLSQHPLYEVHQKMILRCHDETNEAYKNYGARGIEVWKDWREDFVCFYEWCIANGWEKGLSLERKDNDGNYAPYNCKFATTAEQSRNRRNNRFYTAFGETKCLFDWAEDPRCVVGVWTLRGRADNKLWDGRFEEALTTPPEDRKKISARNKKNKNLTAFGETKCMADWVEDERCKCGLDALRKRYAEGWEHEKAIITPAVSRRSVQLTAFGETKGMSDWLKDERCVINLWGLRDRVRAGWPHEKAIVTPALTGSKNTKQLFL